MARAFVYPVACGAIGALVLLACGRIDLGSRAAPEVAEGSARPERPTPPPQISLGGVTRTEIIPAGGPASGPSAGEDPSPDVILEGAPSADAGAPPDAGAPDSTESDGAGGPNDPDAGSADARSCADGPQCGSEGDSCCTRSVVPAGAFQLGQVGDSAGAPASRRWTLSPSSR